MKEQPFVDDFRTAHAFLVQILVRCPGCGEQAEVCRDRRRLTCTNCGQTKGGVEWNTLGPSCDTQGLSLYLQVPCCGELLWAFNREHIEYVREYVGATLRTRSAGEHGWSNQSLASRLPKWMTSAKNRDDLLKGLDRLSAMIAGGD